MPHNVDDRVKWEAFRASMRRRRQQKNLTQTEVAERMGRSQDYVSNLENDPDSIPNLKTIWMWVEALDGTVEVNWL
jgi:transcriptional regulator with XRE-family HTH domain